MINASPGVEPLFSLKKPDGRVREVARKFLPNHEILQKISDSGKLPEDVPNHIRLVLVTSTDIAAIDHLKMVAVLQTVVDESISKTVNLSAEATVSEVREIYESAYRLGLKGMTMCRQGSSTSQPVRLK